MTVTRIRTVSTLLDEQVFALTGRAVPQLVADCKLICCVDESGAYATVVTTITLCYTDEGGTCPAGDNCLGVANGKAVFLESVTTE